MAKRLLFIGGGYESVPAIAKAYALGYTVYVIDGNPQAPGVLWAQKYGQGWGVASTYNANDITRVSDGWQDIDGVIAVAADVGPIVSAIAQYRKLPYIPVEITRLGWYKDELQKRLDSWGILTPYYYRHSAAEYRVVKPIGGRGGRGVGLVKRFSDALPAAVELAKSYSINGKVLVEPFITGPQISSESIIWNGEVVFTGLTDRDYQIDQTFPYIIELGGWGPSRYEGTAIGDDIKAVIQKAVTCLNIRAGSVKCDIVLGNDGPVIIEMAIGRYSGGYSFSHHWPIVYNVDFMAAAFQVACGHRPDIKPLNPKRNYPLYTRGVYKNVTGATKHTERGRFFLAIGRGRAEADRKADKWRST